MPKLTQVLTTAASIGQHVGRALDISGLKHKSMRTLLRCVSERSWVIAPASTSRDRPAIFFSQDLDRVTTVPEDTTLLREMVRIKGGQRELRATKAYLLTNVELSRGFLRKGVWRERILRQTSASPIESPIVSIPEAALACTCYGSCYFGSWIAADLTMSMAASNFGVPIVAEREVYPQEPDYLRLFQMETSMVASGRFARFVMLDDAAQNSYKRERYQTLRDRLRSACGTAGGGKRFYIRRGQRGAPRRLLNESEVQSWLESQGFVVIDPDDQSPMEIARLTNGAELAIGVEGSHMIHALLNLGDQGVLCMIQPPYRFNNPYKDRTGCLGMRYAFTVGFEAGGGFVMPLDHLKRFLEHVENAGRDS